jgi:hypothetical protein
MSGKRVFVVVAAMVLTLQACSAGGTTPQGEERQQGQTSPPAAVPTQNPKPTGQATQGEAIGQSQPQGQDLGSGPNLELWGVPSLISPWGEQGMERIVYVLVGKNASSGWYGYKISDQTTQGTCAWMMNLDVKQRPTLYTEEGHEYQALMPYDFEADRVRAQSGQLSPGLVEWYDTFSFNPQCGAKSAGSYFNPLPPGAGFTAVSENLVFPQELGIVMFDIPETATPKTMQVPYSCLGQWRNLECEVRSADVHLFDVGSVPITAVDESYGVEVHRAGEKIDIGGVANLVVTAKSEGGNAIQLVFVLESKHPGYTLKVYNHEFSFLHQFLRVPRDIIISTVDGQWMDNFRNAEVGPMQTIGMTGSLGLKDEYWWATPTGEPYWLFGHIELKEDSPAAVLTQANYVVELR